MDKGLAVAKHNHSIDYSGVAVDVRISDMQKAIRRGLVDQAMCSFFALFNFVGMFPDDNEHAEAIKVQSHAIKRLIIIAVEDVGPAAPALLCAVLPVLLDMTKPKHTRERDPLLLGSIVTALANAPKSRICSHLYNAYKVANKAVAVEHGLVIPDEITLKSQAVFQWLDTKPIKEVWQYCMWGSGPAGYPSNTHMQLIKSVYTNASEKSKPNVVRYAMCIAHFMWSDGPQGEYVRAQFKTTYVLEQLEEVKYPQLAPLEDSVDVHTKAGKKLGRDAKRFRQVGATVENAHPVMNDPVLQHIYDNYS